MIFIKRKVFILLLLCLCSILLPGDTEKYKWPLSINNGYSASFQEFRGNHFHGGIDLRTFKKTGYPVYAAQSGYITKIRCVKRGSGKGIYVKHSNGYTSIYFHLERFTKKIEIILKRIQRSKGKKYIGNYFFPSPVKVNRGDIIGYSGETGSGFPHLHFEVRDRDNNSVNPFKLINFLTRDTNYPVLKGIILRSIGETSINGKIGESTFKFTDTNNSLSLKEPVFITGEFEIVLNTYDISDTGKTVSPHKIEFFLNEKNIFSLIFEKFSYNDNNQLGFVYDMFHSSPSSYFFNIFFQKGFELEKKKYDTEKLYNNLKEGTNKVMISVSDNFGNTRAGTFSIIKIKSPDIIINEPYISKNDLIVKLNKFEPSVSDNITINLYDEDQSLLYTGTPEIKNLLEKKEIVLKDVEKKIVFIEFLFKKNSILLNKKRFSFNNTILGDTSKIEFTRYINRDFVTIRINTKDIASNNIELELVQGDKKKKINPVFDANNIIFCFKPLNDKKLALLNFSIYNNSKMVAQIQEKIFLIYLRNEYQLNMKYDDFSAYFGMNSVKEDKVLSVDIINLESDYPVESDQMMLYPYTFPFLDTVYYKFRKDLPNPAQVGIFKYSHKSKRWYYKFTTYKNSDKTFSTRLISSGIFSLMRDIFPPRIKFLKTGRKKTLVKQLNIIISDKGKGVNDESIKVSLNGKNAEQEFDPDWNLLKVLDIQKLTKWGKNILKIYVEDNGGNVSIREKVFYLK